MDRLGWLLEGLGTGLPAVATSLGFIIFAVGAAVLLGIRSWFLALAAALPVATALLIASAELAGLGGLELPVVAYLGVSLGLVLVTTVALRVAGGGGNALTLRDFAPTPLLVWAGAALGAAVALGAWLAGIGDFHIPPQANDDIWHGYLVERLTHMPSITASAVAPTSADASVPVVFYQYGLHLVGAVMHEMTGISVAETLNGIWAVHIGLLAPVGSAALAWSLFPARPWAAFWAGAFASGIAVFPYLTNGILPYTASLAMAPGLLALLLLFLEESPRISAAGVAAAAVGIFVTHPSGAVAVAVIGALVTAEHLLRDRDRVRSAVRRLAVVGALVLLWSLPWLLAAGQRKLGQAEQGIVLGLSDAIGMAISSGSPWTPPQPTVAGLAIIGMVATVMLRRGVAISLSLLLFSVLFIGVAVGAPWAGELTRVWHGNWYRLLAVVGMVVPVLAGLGTASLARGAAGISTRLGFGGVLRPTTVAPIVIGAIALAGIAHGAVLGQSIARSAWHDPHLVTLDEMRLFDQMSREMGLASRVLNSPRDGSGWMYALNNLTPVQPYVYGRPSFYEEMLAGSGRYRHPSTACLALMGTRATHAFAKGVRGDVGAGEYDVPGFVDRHRTLFSEVARSGDAVLYQIDPAALERCADN